MHRFAVRVLTSSRRCLSRSASDDENRKRNIEGRALEKQVQHYPPAQLVGRAGIRLDVATGEALLHYLTSGCPKAMERKEELEKRIVDTYKEMPLRLATITEGSDLVHHSLLVHHGLKTPFKIEEALRRLRMDGMEGRQLGRSLDALHRYRKADAAKKAEMLLHESGLMALLLLTSFDDEAISSYSNLPTPKLELDLSGSIRCTGEGAVVISLIEVKRELNVQAYRRAATQLNTNSAALAKALKAMGLAKQVHRRGVLVFLHPMDAPPVSELQQKFSRKMPSDITLPPLELVRYDKPLYPCFRLEAEAELLWQERRNLLKQK